MNLKTVLVRGRVQVRETRRPLADVVVQVYWVDSGALSSENRSWFQRADDDMVARLAGDDVTTPRGSFSLSLEVGDSIGDRAAVGLAILPPDDETVESVEPIHVSSVPRSVRGSASFLIAIPMARLEDAGMAPPGPSTGKLLSRLDQEEKNSKEISQWLERDQKDRDKSVRKITDRSAAAFADFRPSTLAESVRKQDNYLDCPAPRSQQSKGDWSKKRRKLLASALSKVRARAFDRAVEKNAQRRAGDSPSAEKSAKTNDHVGLQKTRRMRLTGEAIKKLQLIERDKGRIDYAEFSTIVEETQKSSEDSIANVLSATEERRDRNRKIVDELWRHLQNKRDKAHPPQRS